MKAIGITGGVGSGKSELLAYVKEQYHCRILFADQVAHQLEEVGKPCYEQLLEVLGSDILRENGSIDRKKMAQHIFADENLRMQVNKIVHPAVKAYVLEELQKERERDSYDFFFLEAALLIEEHYEEVLDELWYISTKENIRKERLQQSRDYSEEKIMQIMKGQLQEAGFLDKCTTVIMNNGSLEEAMKQMDEKLGEYL